MTSLEDDELEHFYKNVRFGPLKNGVYIYY